MSWAIESAKRLARIGGPTLRRLHLEGALVGAETYSAFLRGCGSGSGWDIANETSTIASFLPAAPAVIFDVGANNGEWSKIFAAHRQRADDRHYLFECVPYCYEGIEQRIGQIPNPVLAKFAVSDTVGSAKMFVPSRGSGLASLHERHDVCVVQELYREMDVPTNTLDNYAAEQGVTFVDLLKMDIEGHEIFALRGAKDLLKAGAIGVVTFEFGSGNVNSRTFFRDFWELLTGSGFTIYRILPGGGTLQVKRYGEHLEYFRGATNYVAVNSKAARTKAA